MNASQVLHFDPERCQPSTSWRASLTICALLALLSPLGWGCDPATPQSPTTKAQPSPQPQPSPSTNPPSPSNGSTQLVQGSIYGQPLNLSVEDFVRWSARGILYAPDEALASGVTTINTAQLSMPHVQTIMAQSMLKAQLVEREAQRRGLTASEQEISAALDGDPMLARFQPDGVHLKDGRVLPSPLVSFGLSVELLRAYARQDVLADKLIEALLKEITDEQIWESWRTRQDKASAIIVQISNTPTSQEISSLIESQPERIKSYLEAHPDRFQTPKMTLLTMLRFADPSAAPALQLKALEAAVAELKAGAAVQEVAKKHNLKIDLKQRLMRQEDSEAAQAKVGQVGLSKDRPRGTYAWVVEGFEEPRMPPLNPALQREIAAELLRTSAPNPAALKSAAIAQQYLKTLKAAKLDVASRDAIEALNGARVFELQDFAHEPNGYIPKIGLVPELAQTLFSFESSTALTAEPVFSREDLYVARLTDRKRPRREDFEAQKTQLRDSLIKELRPVILDQYLGKLIDDNKIQMNLAPLRERYGRFEKKKTTP